MYQRSDSAAIDWRLHIHCHKVHFAWRQTLDHKGQAPLIAADLEKELAHVAEGL